MSDDATLVARLKARGLMISEGCYVPSDPLCSEAAARITALEAENVELRAQMTWRPIETAPDSPHKPWTPVEREAEADFQSALRGVATTRDTETR